MSCLAFWIRFVRLASQRKKSKMNYLLFQQHQARQVLASIEKTLKISADSLVIDYGCGTGGYTYILAKKFNRVLGIDFYLEPLKTDDKLRFEKHNLLLYQGKEKAGFIFCSSVIEHIEDKEAFIRNLCLNLKEGGHLYFSFPPFYSPVGGHMFKPFHYLPEPLAMEIARLAGKVAKDAKGFKEAFGTWGLYKTTIKEIKSLLVKNGFRIIDYKVRFFPINLAKIPIMGEFLTWHVEFYCIKA